MAESETAVGLRSRPAIDRTLVVSSQHDEVGSTCAMRHRPGSGSPMLCSGTVSHHIDISVVQAKVRGTVGKKYGTDHFRIEVHAQISSRAGAGGVLIAHHIRLGLTGAGCAPMKGSSHAPVIRTSDDRRSPRISIPRSGNDRRNWFLGKVPRQIPLQLPLPARACGTTAFTRSRRLPCRCLRQRNRCSCSVHRLPRTYRAHSCLRRANCRRQGPPRRCSIRRCCY